MDGYIVWRYQNNKNIPDFYIFKEKVHKSIKSAIDTIVDSLLLDHDVYTDDEGKFKYECKDSDEDDIFEKNFSEWSDDNAYDFINSYKTKDEFRNYIKKHLGYNDEDNKYCIHCNGDSYVKVFDSKCPYIYGINVINSETKNSDEESEPPIYSEDVSTNDLFLEHIKYKIFQEDFLYKKSSTYNLITYDDEFIEGKYTGEMYVSKFKKIRHGKGVLHFNNGNVFNGEFIDNKIYKGKMICKNGDIFNGEFIDNKIYKGMMIYKNGDVFGGNFENEQMKNGTLTYNNGDVFNGEFKDNKIYKGKLDYSKYNNIDGYFYEGTWKNGKKHGIGFSSQKLHTVTHSQKWKYGYMYESVKLDE